VSGLCNALLRDRAEAEDAAQQTFLAAHRALLNGSTPREPAAWLATIARNECWSRIRARMREPLPTDELDARSFTADPLTEAIRSADLAALWRAIAELPRQQRDALLLREFGGLSYDELAGALAVTGPAVESLLFRARQGVRARLQTAYAAVSGVGWVETLMRLAAGASSSAAPVAAKAVVVAGVGAAVATGGVVVAPHMFDQQRQARPHQAARAPLHIVQAVRAERAAPPAAAPRIFVAAHPLAPVRNGDEQGSSTGEGSRMSGSGDGQQPLASGDGGSRQEAADLAPQPAAPAGQPESDSSGSDGSDGSGGTSSGGGDAQPPAASGGLTAPAPNPAVTVAAPTGDEPPGTDG
jgi:RNA polymerase sigma factor (sigma-70 family)